MPQVDVSRRRVLLGAVLAAGGVLCVAAALLKPDARASEAREGPNATPSWVYAPVPESWLGSQHHEDRVERVPMPGPQRAKTEGTSTEDSFLLAPSTPPSGNAGAVAPPSPPRAGVEPEAEAPDDPADFDLRPR